MNKREKEGTLVFPLQLDSRQFHELQQLMTLSEAEEPRNSEPVSLDGGTHLQNTYINEQHSPSNPHC
jgi:hypothetical protein